MINVIFNRRNKNLFNKKVQLLKQETLLLLHIAKIIALLMRILIMLKI
jgi:hypothetical protein